MARQKDKTRWEDESTSGFVIRLVKKGKPYQVDFGTVNGKRERKRYATLGEAKNAAGERRKEIEDKGTDALSLSDRDRLEAGEARKALGNVAIMEAVRFYLRHNAPGAVNMTVAELIEAYLAAPGRRGNKSIVRRERTLSAARNRLEAFKAAFGTRPAAEIGRGEIEAWTASGKWSGLNLRNYVSNVRALYSFAVRKEWLAMNPAEKIEVAEDPEARRPRILSAGQVKALFTTAAKLDAALVPRLALAFFAGIRSAEMDRLDWSAVNVSAGRIAIEPAVAKMRRQRHVTMTENLKAWLLPYRKNSGPIWSLSEESFYQRLADVAKVARVKVPSNAGRHAFASYHYALHQDAPRTAFELGHAKPALLLDVYRDIRAADGKPITQETARAYFEIHPPKAADVIPLPLEAAG